MANRPVNAGSGGAAAPPPPVHHDATPATPATPAPPAPPAAPPAAPAPATPPARSRNPAGHRAPRARAPRARAPRDPASRDGEATAAAGLAWLPYLIVLAGVAAGMFVIWQGSKYAGRGAALVGCSLLAGALARLILPARYAGPLASRRKASDVLAFAAFGAAVLAVAIALP
jgi:Protein of unknown function (DUF3017)